MASLGFPIENDKYYPDLQDEVPDNYEKPLQLLAMELEFADPLSDGIRRFQIPQKAALVKNEGIWTEDVHKFCDLTCVFFERRFEILEEEL